MANAPGDCFHCGEPLVAGAVYHARVRDDAAAFCCPGCRAAAQLIGELGLADFYRFRTSPAGRPQQSSDEWLAYDEPQVQENLTRAEPDGRSIVLLVGGLTCAACSWLVTRVLEGIAGVIRASVNTATGRATVVWDPSRVALSRLLRVVADLGYRPQAVTAEATRNQAAAERRAILKRLAVAGLGMMQVMMFAVALYAGAMQGMDGPIRDFLRIVSLLVATPVMLYSGRPFFLGAVQAVRLRRVTMDVPVSLGLMLAYGASIFDTWRHSGEVYFDSVTMFIFFLTVARFVEMIARHQSAGVTDALSRLLPAIAHRVADTPAGERLTDVAVAAVAAGDRLLVRAGEVVPADGEIASGCTRVDESLLTGEPLPVARAGGDRLAAGTINLDAPVYMRVTAAGPATTLSGIVALLNRAQAERPRITCAADRTASRFLTRVLIGAVLVGIFWCIVDPAKAFDATLSVLVVACPCALSLATLVAMASATAALARRGVLITHPDAIEGLARTTRVIFDKTGTLTSGIVTVTGRSIRGAKSAQQCVDIAAALEAASEHPIARAFAGLRVSRRLDAGAVRIVPGSGLEGVIDGTRYRIGTRAFIGCAGHGDDAEIVLGTAEGELAAFTLGDRTRPEGPDAVAAIQRLLLAVEIQSGDGRDAVERIAQIYGINCFSARQTPLDKLQRARHLTAQGDFVAMVGDGINDAPVLAGAGVSIAMSQGSGLALASAGVILVADSLQALPEAFAHARRAQRIIRQNLSWAAAYNLTAMPLAAMGWVPPWLAAIGMSLSSILVVLNSMRLMHGAASDRTWRGPAATPAGAQPITQAAAVPLAYVTGEPPR
jgi:Cu2+-exporting ATPase